MIPRHIYFIFGLAQDFDQKPFGLVHYLAVKSAKIVNPNFEVSLYYHYEPSGVWWDRVKDYCHLIPYTPLKDIFGNPLDHPAYKADIFRLQTMNERGGVYLDIDTICVRSFAGLLDNEFVMAEEVVDGAVLGLCNATLMAVPNSTFGRLWMDEYKYRYTSKWGDMQVRRPHQIAKANPKTLTVLPSDAFFKYGWNPSGLIKVHEEVNSMEGAYSLHLWEQMSYFRYLSRLTVNEIKMKPTTYNLLARIFV